MLNEDEDDDTDDMFDMLLVVLPGLVSREKEVDFNIGFTGLSELYIPVCKDKGNE